MNYSTIEAQARKQAIKSKPSICEIDGKIYSFSFNPQTWNYDVYEDGFLLMIYNTKNISTAKKWLREYLNG